MRIGLRNASSAAAGIFGCLGLAATLCAADAAAPASATDRGDVLVAEYFRRETEALTGATLADIQSLDDWTARCGEYRQQLFEMLGLDPLPERTPLKPVITGSVEHDDFLVEKLHFQSRPGLYVTANLYRPKEVRGPLPAVLYVCGHGQVKKDGISYGNKVAYQHHGAWFARHGYVCLVLDTLQLGEIEGIHHGTYRENMWWWHSYGYTPAGVEAWNCIRALDYLETRPEVDARHIGVTGRSGGGAYSWWIAALDDRIQAAVPVAGITSLKNHVVDGCVEGHCDCMYPVNTYRWDFPLVAALVAPRPLLISNTDKDTIFPLDGVIDVHAGVRRIYALHGAADKLGLQITEGPHKDTQPLQVHAFGWMNRFLTGSEPLIERAAVPFFEPQQLKVFDTLPADEQNTRIQETFVARPQSFPVPESAEAWAQQRDAWRTALREKCFRGWPAESADVAGLKLQEVFNADRDGVRLSVYEFTSQPPYRLRLFFVQPSGVPRADLEQVVLSVLDQRGWERFVRSLRPGFPAVVADEPVAGDDVASWRETCEGLSSQRGGVAFLAPRGVGPTEWTREDRERVHIRRRFALLGQTDDGMRVWDVRQGVHAVRALSGLQLVPLQLQGERDAAGWALYAALFEPDITRLDLWQLSTTHREGPIFLNVMRFLDTPQAVALAAEHAFVQLLTDDREAWQYPRAVAANLGWDDEHLQFRAIPPARDQSEP